ncbi:MAG: hypothetical protein FWD56_00445 [Bacteroidales bacterium]|nr:hypothetical protein [Bacteroidales bacterium]
MKTKGCKKTGGRVRGTPNKVGADLRAWIAKLLDDNRRVIAKDLKALEPYQRLSILTKLIDHVLPRQQAIEAKIDLNKLTDYQLDAIITEITKDLSNEN